MKEILIIPVGGTICTSLSSEGTLKVDEKAGILLIENYLKSDSVYTSDVNFTLSKNLYILSENMTVEKWNLIIEAYREHTLKKEYDGVIIAHGTDSLAYSAALFSVILENTKIPVFFVSSNERLVSARANGNDNFRCAVECIVRGILPDVYVPYKNLSDGRMLLHRGKTIEQCKNYSEDFYSRDSLDISSITDENCKEYFSLIEKNQSKNNISVYGDWHLLNCVLMIEPYVGLNYDVYDYAKFSAVLHGTYHSGTACSEKSREWPNYGTNSVLYMIDLCIDKNIDVYFSPAKLVGELYETVPTIKNHRANEIDVNFMYGATKEYVYAKLVVAYSIFSDKEKIKNFMDVK